jgi:hypothetical protein
MGFIRNKRRQLLVHFDHAGESVLSGRVPAGACQGRLAFSWWSALSARASDRAPTSAISMKQ